MQNHYDVLGVSRESTQDEIKKAYRKKAAEFHPDRNKAADATEKMASVNAAYETLSDEQKRQIHNDELDGKRRPNMGDSPFGDMFVGGFGGFGGVNIEELFNFFERSENGRRRQQQQTGPNTEIFLTLKDVLHGKQMDIEIPVKFPCSGCSANGYVVGEFKTCETCKGKGRVEFRQGPMVAHIGCNKCGGQGKTNRIPCVKCSGQGFIENKVKTGINIPCGMRNGNVMEYTVKADGMSAKAYILYTVESHPIFEVIPNGDIIRILKIDYPTAVLGKPVQVETIDGKINSFKIPNGTHHGMTVRIPGAGLPRGVNSRIFGDMLLEIELEVPQNLTTAQKEALEKFQSLLENKQ